jgi:Flp pilus assembly pilin Flp
MDSITVAAVAGAIAPALVAVITRAPWPATVKRWTAIGVAVGLALVGMLSVWRPDTWAQIAAGMLAAIGVAQTVYTALKPVWTSLEALTTPATGGATPRAPEARQ